MKLTRSTTTALACACLALSVSACSQGDGRSSSQEPAASSSATSTSMYSPSPIPTGTTKPNPRGVATPISSVKRADAEAVGQAFLVALNTSDTKIDTSPWNAADRAAVLASSSYAATLRQQSVAAPGAAWNAMEAAKGYTSAKVTLVPSNDPLPSTPTDAYLTYEVTVTTHGAKADPQKSSVFMHLHRANASSDWQVVSSDSTYE